MNDLCSPELLLTLQVLGKCAANFSGPLLTTTLFLCILFFPHKPRK